MFCLGCGAEAPLRAVQCPVCGRALGRNAAEASRFSAAGMGASPSAAAPAQLVTFSNAASGRDTPGLPGDMRGRIAVATVVAMAVDLLAPWMVVNGTHQSILSIGAPVLIAVPVLGAALLPLLYPSLRRKPVFAAIPMIVGSVCIGAVVAFWAALTYLSYQTTFVVVSSVDTGIGSSPSTSPLDPSSVPTASHLPDVGLYLFLLGGALLIYTGYFVFLAAARDSHGETARMPASPVLIAPTVAPPLPLQAGMPTYAAPATVSLPLADTVSRPLSTGFNAGVISEWSQPVAPYGGPAAGAAAEGAGAGEADLRRSGNGASTPAADESVHVALPGSAEWNEAPHQPEYVRPALGWQRGRGPRR